MNIEIKKIDLKDKDEILNLYQKAEWVKQDETNLEWLSVLIQTSFCFVKIVSHNKIIGMGRVITDKVSDAYIQDLFILEEYRNKGLGKKLVNYLVDYIKKNNINWIALIAEPGSANFYKSIGFNEMQNHTPMKL